MSNATGFISKLRDSDSGEDQHIAIEENDEVDEAKVDLQEVHIGLQTS